MVGNRHVSREFTGLTEVTQNSLDDDIEKPSFWEQVYSNRLFCSTECSQRCSGDAEENEAHDDWYPVRMSYDDEQPIANLPHACLEPMPKPVDLTSKQKQFSLPWADLDGARSVPRQASRRHAYDDDLEATKSLLPLSSKSFGSDFRGLPKPRFVSGIPTKASEYKPKASDPIDVKLHQSLQALNQEESMVLALYRVEPGRYEIDGRQVRLYWESNAHGRLLVHEDEVDGASIADMPLPTYIRLVANVAMDLQRPVATGNNAMTFYEPAAVILSKSTDGDRYRAMRIACTQARLREEGA